MRQNRLAGGPLNRPEHVRGLVLDVLREQAAQDSSEVSCNTIELVFAGRCVVPDEIYHVVFPEEVFVDVFKHVSNAFPTARPFSRSTKRYRFLDMTCEVHGSDKEVRVRRAAVLNCHTSASDSARCEADDHDDDDDEDDEDEEQEDGGRSTREPLARRLSSPAAVLVTSHVCKMPVSSFPCTTDMDDIGYVRTAVVPILRGGACEVRFESRLPDVEARCAPGSSDPVRPLNRVSLGLNLQAMRHIRETDSRAADIAADAAGVVFDVLRRWMERERRSRPAEAH